MYFKLLYTKLSSGKGYLRPAASKSNESTKLNPKVLISYTLVKVSQILQPKLSLKHMLLYLYFILIFSSTDSVCQLQLHSWGKMLS